MTRKFAMVALAVFLAGCAYPTQRDEQGTGLGQIYFPGARQGDHVTIDDRDAGAAIQYDGRLTLPVPVGLHHVIVTSGGGVVLDKKVYVGANAKVPVQEP